MKHKFCFYTIFLLFIISSFGGCKKHKDNPVDQLPPATQTGANTMGCYVNGKVWLPDTKDNGSIPRLKAVNAKLWNITDLLFTFYRQRNPDDQDLDIYITNFEGKGIYNMNMTSRIVGLPGSNGPLNNYLYYADDNENLEFATNENYNGTVIITYYDATKKIVSGTFQFKGQNIKGTSDSVIVTDGRFDCTLY